MNEYFNVDHIKLRNLCTEIFVNEGVPKEDAYIVADSLVEADLTNVSSHGVTRVKMYIDSIRNGGTAAKADIKIINAFPSGVLLNAGSCLGIVAGYKAVQMAIKKAKENGIGIANIAHSNHCGSLAYYGKKAAKENVILICTTNAPSTMVPWGSREKYFGTNPICITIPTNDDPIILDMATSVVARGKILLAEKEGASIPEGWAIDTEGKPTTNAAAALKGSVLPFGGPKGSGIAMMVDILSGILSGSAFGIHMNDPFANKDKCMETGHCFIAIDVAQIRNIEGFLNDIDIMVSEIKGLQPVEGVDEIFVPGELEFNSRNNKLKEGINIPKAVFEELMVFANQYDIVFDIRK